MRILVILALLFALSGELHAQPQWKPLGLQQGEHRSSLAAEDTTCKLRFAYGHSYNANGDYKSGFQILKSYAERCYDEINSFRVFAELDLANSSMSSDIQRYPDYREWLKTVLYLNQSDPLWYCECVKSIANTLQWDERSRGVDYNGGIAIVRFLLASGKCPQDSSNLSLSEAANRKAAHNIWQDTCAMFGHDTNLFPFDTTIPTLHELGLDILYGPNGAVKNGAIMRTLADLHVVTNPFTNTTQATIELPEMTYLRFELFDLLGNVVQGDDRGRTYPAGSASFTIDGKDLAPGIYFARVSTSTGETRTARVVRE